MKRIIQSILKPFGLRLARLEKPQPAFGLDVLFGLLKRFGFAPKQIIDVGANHGNWTRKAIEYFPDANYTLLEPQESLECHVRDLVERGFKIQWIQAGVSDSPGTLPFFISNRDDSSTFAAPKTGGPPPIMVKVRTLNEIVSACHMSAPDMVKIDAEGFDLKVLSGASELLGKTDVFLVEVLVCCVDPHQNTALAVMQFMAKAGYRLIDITEINRSPKDNVLWLCELVFLRNGSALLQSVNSYV